MTKWCGATTRCPPPGPIGALLVAFLVCSAHASFPQMQMPAALAAADTMEAVQPFLADPDMTIRAYAAARAVEVADDSALGPLLEAFYREPRGVGFDPQPAKVAILRALGRMDDPLAVGAVAGILCGYISSGPTDERYIWHDGDYVSVCRTALNALADHTERPVALGLLRAIALDGERSSRLDWLTREVAYRGYLIGLMRDRGATEPEQAAAYLVGELTGTGAGHEEDWVAGQEGLKTLEALRNGAIVRLLVELGPPSLPAAKQAIAELTSADARRREALERVIQLIEQSQVPVPPR